MHYYLVAGEASGDLHASRLMQAIRQQDPAATFRGIGGDMMKAQGAELMQHYRDLAYMGFLPVIRHLPTILRGMKQCQQDILQHRPDCLILVDYPGFNLRIARFVRQHTQTPIVYYIAPKLWAWKEHRIKDIRRNVDLLLSILPFEVSFYQEKHHFPVHYVGNPTVDEVAAWLEKKPDETGKMQLPIIALLPGSRKQEVESNLPRMLLAAEPYAKDYQIAVAAAPSLSDDFYKKVISRTQAASQLSNIQHPLSIERHTFSLLSRSRAALVTSGTATLEAALFGVPQVVCYHMKAGRLASLARRLFLKVPFISLVNLIAEREVVPELVAEQMNVENTRRHLAAILPNGSPRETQLQGYKDLASRLGPPGAPTRAAQLIAEQLAMA